MKFNINEWRKYYDRIKARGQQITDSYPSRDKYGRLLPAAHPLSDEEFDNLQIDIKVLLKKLTNYLNNSQLPYPKPLWKYSVKDRTTWASDPSFKYQHLLKDNI